MKIGGDTNVTAVEADVRNSYLLILIFSGGILSRLHLHWKGGLESIPANHLKYGECCMQRTWADARRPNGK